MLKSIFLRSHKQTFVMKKQLYLILLISIICTRCISQDSFAAVGDWLHTNLHEIGGRGVIMVWKDGKVVYSHAENKLSGREKATLKWMANQKGDEAQDELQDFSANTQKPIASCSKWLSAAVIMTFVQEGKISLEDTVGKYFVVMTQHKKGGITIKDCLSHLTGINAPPVILTLEEPKESLTLDETMEKIAKMPMDGEPGKSFHYSSVGLQIAAGVVEKVSRQRFELLFQQRIAKPCGIKHTSFGGELVVSPAGGAWSTPEDYLQFLSMILNDGKYNGKQILTKESIIAMQQDYTKGVKLDFIPDEARPWGYGFGEWVLEEGNGRGNVLSSPGLFGTFPWVDNQRKYAAILFTTNVNFSGRHNRYSSLKSIVDEAIGK